MTTSDASAISCYKEIAVIDAGHGVTLVQHNTSGIIYVKKILTVYNADVYRYLQSHHISGIPEIVEIAESDGRLTVIEEYIGGQTLRDILDNGNVFPQEDAVAIVEQLFRILEELHSADPPILHRDIKPSNIICMPDGSIRLLDLNAAKQVDPGSRKGEDTNPIGTVGYAAPEQYGFGTSSVQTDIYATGVLLCELVTGSLPKDGIPGGKLGRIIRKCTRIDPKDRYKSVQELLEVLAACHRETAEPYVYSSAGKYMIPGFRSRKPVNILIALFVYGFFLSLSLSYTAEGIEPGFQTWVERIIYTVFGFMILFFTGNYLNIWSVMGISRIRSSWLRFLAVIAFDCLLAAIMILVMIFAALAMGAYHFVS